MTLFLMFFAIFSHQNSNSFNRAAFYSGGAYHLLVVWNATITIMIMIMIMTLHVSFT